MVSAKGGKKDLELLLPDLTNGETSRDVFVSLGLNQPRSQGLFPAKPGKRPGNEVGPEYDKMI